MINIIKKEKQINVLDYILLIKINNKKLIKIKSKKYIKIKLKKQKKVTKYLIKILIRKNIMSSSTSPLQNLIFIYIPSSQK